MSNNTKDILDTSVVFEDIEALKGNSNLEKYTERLNLIKKYLSAEVLNVLLPDPEIRPILLAAIMHELSVFDTIDFDTLEKDNAISKIQESIKNTRIFKVIDKEYKPVHMKDIVNECKNKIKTITESSASEKILQKSLGGLSRLGLSAIIPVFLKKISGEKVSDLNKWYYETLIKGDDKSSTLNSTLKNLGVAAILNETVFKDTPNKAKLALAQYSWDSHMAQSNGGQIPTLPNLTNRKDYLKFVIAVSNGEETETYLDYGQNKGNEKYGVKQSGEGPANIIGTPFPQKLIDTGDLDAVARGIGEIGKTQEGKDDQEAIRRIHMHLNLEKHLVDFMQEEEGKNYPEFLSGIGDLSIAQLNSTLGWAKKAKKMWESSLETVGSNTTTGEFGTIYSKFSGKTGAVLSSMPSTRTTTAAAQALESLGMKVQSIDTSSSSREKGEGNTSEDVTFHAHGIDVLLARDSYFEKDVKALKKSKNKHQPSRISLGGNEYHPTQTLGEVLVLMDEYDCSTIEELSEKTKYNPPLFIFMGHTKFKRADKSLIQFIIEYLPHWKIKNIIPNDKYETGIEGDNFEVIVDNNLTDTNNVTELTKGGNFIYISNPEGTSLDGGKGDGKKSADYRLNTETVEKNGLKVFHPLPAGEDKDGVICEIDPNILEEKNEYINQQMKNKVAVISSMLAHQLSAKSVK